MFSIIPPEFRKLVDRAFEKAFGIKSFAYICAAFTLLVFAGLIARFGASLGVLVLGATIIFSFALLLIVLGQATKLSGSILSVPAQILIWVVTLCFSIALILIVWSAFFDKPLPIRTWIIAKLGTDTNRAALVEEKTAQQIKAPVTSRQIRQIVISETETPPKQTTIRLADYLTTTRPKVGYHFIVDRAGIPYPFADLSETLYHTPGYNEDSVAIGLEHQTGEEFPPAQIQGLKTLVANLAHRFKISPDHVFSKEQLRPESRRDITKFIQEIRESVAEQQKT
jgi:N-acetylmuramoyl-L-alanine amidase